MSSFQGKFVHFTMQLEPGIHSVLGSIPIADAKPGGGGGGGGGEVLSLLFVAGTMHIVLIKGGILISGVLF